jgi:hypothetical protein
MPSPASATEPHMDGDSDISPNNDVLTTLYNNGKANYISTQDFW